MARRVDTFGATLYDPVRLTLCGESMPGGDTAGADEVTAVRRLADRQQGEAER